MEHLISTKEFENRIECANSREELNKILAELPQMTFTERFKELCDLHGFTLSQVQVASGITKSLFYDIFKKGTRNSKKEQVIKAGIAMGLSVEELNELLKLARHKELYAKRKDDAIIIFGLRNKLSVTDIEQLLIDSNAGLHLIDKD